MVQEGFRLHRLLRRAPRSREFHFSAIGRWLAIRVFWEEMAGKKKRVSLADNSFHMAVYLADNIGFATDIFLLLSFPPCGLSIDRTTTAAAIHDYSHRRPYQRGTLNQTIVQSS